MRAALAVNLVTTDWKRNLSAIEGLICGAAALGAQLVLFGEAALTGALNDDQPEHDLPLGVAIPGPETDRLADLARAHSLHIGIGLLERCGNHLYDTAVLLAPNGRIILKYRRISRGWRGQQADTQVYREGDTIPTVETPLGRIAFLICGDLFDDSLVRRVRREKPDLLLLPFTRSYTGGVIDQTRWEREDEPDYAVRAALVGTTLLMTNYLVAPTLVASDGSFGGAAAFSASGDLLGRWPQGWVGMMLVELAGAAVGR